MHEIEERQISALKPFKKNARTHSDAQIMQIADSIKEWGWTIPVLIDEDDTIIAGHGRVLAATAIGMDVVPVLVAKGWSEAQKSAYVLADNKLAANAGWDFGKVQEALAELREWGFEIELTGFGDVGAAVDFREEWKGMPEFDQPDKMPHRTLKVHFRDDAAAADFAGLIGQQITSKTQFVWYPELEREHFADKAYLSEPEAPRLHRKQGKKRHKANGARSRKNGRAVSNRSRSARV